MNNICNKYISHIKSLFPIMGKNERNYILTLKKQVEDYCNEEEIKTLDLLYEKYGYPHDIVETYFSLSDMSKIIKKIQINKWIKYALVSMLIIITLLSTIWSVNTYKTFQIFQQEQAVLTNTELE